MLFVALFILALAGMGLYVLIAHDNPAGLVPLFASPIGSIAIG